MEWIIPMIAGLLLDMCGAYIVLTKNLRLTTIGPDIGGPIPDNATEDERERLMQRYLRDKFLHMLRESWDENRVSNSWTKWGLSFMMTGFGLVMFASILNYYL